MADQLIINPMIEAALKAAHIALRRRKEGVQTIQKPDGSFVTSGDYQCQQIIEAELQKISPQMAQSLGEDKIDFLMEETLDGKKHNFAGRMKGAHWVVDPIDGTTGYKQKEGDEARPWAVSIALEKDGQTLAAAVYEAAANEYGNRREDFASITPDAPKGKIFWASANEPSAHKLEGGFRITPANNTSYAQQQNPNGLLTLTYPLPELSADFAQARDTLLTADIQPTANVRPYIDGFYQDGQTRNRAQEASHKKAFCDNCGFTKSGYDDCYSAVAGAMRAADGRTNAYLSGRGFPWDHSAARLILEKSGTNFTEYAILGNDEQRSMLVAGRDKNTFAKMNEVIATMQDEQQLPIAAQPTPRRSFLAGMLGMLGLGKMFGLETPPAPPPPPPAPQQTASANPHVIDHLPSSVEALEKLSDPQKIMLAAVTASGCDAVAYYKPDGNGAFAAEEIIQLYPPTHYRESGGKQPAFAATTSYNANTHQDTKQVLANTQYHIAVPLRDKDGNPTEKIQGIIVLHAPQESFSKLQTSVEENKNDLHESVPARLAKLRLAENIIGEHQEIFGATGALLKQPKTLAHKIAYFNKILKGSYATLGEGNDQQAHAESVAGLMDLSVQKILGSNISKEQAELIHDIAALHDIGKSQMSSAFMRPWRQAATPEAQQYFFEQNHNHPLFTLLELLTYPAEAKMAAAHHHGLFRYGNEELKHALGEDFSKFSILKDNLTPEQISPLSYLMRICDVAESMTGRGAKTLDVAVQELAEKVQMQEGKPLIAAGTIHPDYLCLAIKKGVFDAYERNANPEKLRAAEAAVLEKFGWVGEAATQKEAALMSALTNDPVLVENKTVSNIKQI